MAATAATAVTGGGSLGCEDKGVSKIEAIVFDCFGVLYVDESEAYFARFPGLGTQLRELNSACDHGFISRQEYLAGVSEITGDSPEVINEAFKREHVINQPLIDYIAKELKPHYKIGLLSNIGRDWIQNFFDEHELHELFDAAVLSSTEGITKPEAEIYRRTAERLNVAPEACIMIDDRQENCHGAEVVGMQSIFYESFEQMQRDLAVVLKK